MMRKPVNIRQSCGLRWLLLRMNDVISLAAAYVYFLCPQSTRVHLLIVFSVCSSLQ